VLGVAVVGSGIGTAVGAGFGGDDGLAVRSVRVTPVAHGVATVAS
jgi:hypothetical protein